MARWPLRAALTGLAMLAAGQAAAQSAPPAGPTMPVAGDVGQRVPAADSLDLAEVLASSRRHAPAILEALAERRIADARLDASRGAFDLVFAAEGNTRLTGFYDGSYVEGKAIQPLTNNGGQVEASYRVSRGDFPTYDDYNFTNQLGELKVRGVFALLRDRYIDDRRFGVRNAAIERDIADIEALLVAIGVQQRAIEAYNQWVTAGLQVDIYRDLLQLAQDRQAGLRREVELGARAEITLTENEQNLLRRQGFVVSAERDLASAAARLSLFLRDETGRPLLPEDQRRPRVLPQLSSAVTIDAESVLGRRPDLKLIRSRIEQAETKLALDRNKLLPSIKLWGELSNDLGPTGQGGLSREGFESALGFTFTMPLQNRAAKGQVAATEASLDALAYRQQRSEEQIVNQIEQLQIGLEAAERLARLAQAEMEQAQKLAAGERRLFQSGASDFFLVNLREEAAANAAVRRLDAEFRLLAARADLIAVAADLDTLGLDPDVPAMDADTTARQDPASPPMP